MPAEESQKRPEVLAPGDANELTDALARASRAQRRVAIRGGGTKLEWGDPAPAPDIVLSTTRLNAVIAHRHGDLTATVESGARLDDVNRALARRGQWIPLDPLWSNQATIGGIVATNDSGPRRQRYGTPRDLILGVELARVDGVLAKAGGNVVKNVAGYDIGRLVTGSFGSLGVIVRATFKLYPIPPSSRTVIVEASTHEAVGALVLAISGSQLTPTAIELQLPPPRLLIRFESSESSVEGQSEEAVRLAGTAGARVTIAKTEEEARIWAEHARMWERNGAIAKVTFLPSELVGTLDWLARETQGMIYEVSGRAGQGVLFLRLDAAPLMVAAQSRIVSLLRQRLRSGCGSVVLLRASDDLKNAVGAWGPMGDAFPLMQAVKRAFDPNRLLNPGRGPGGL